MIDIFSPCFRRMNSSNLICDCQLSWLPRWLRDAGFAHSVELRCAHPASLHNESVFSVNRDQFECGESARGGEEGEGAPGRGGEGAPGRGSAPEG